MIEITDTDALIVVDVQNDFCPGGALPVPYGHTVVTKIRKVLMKFDHLVFSRDLHPQDHCSFSDTPEFKDGSWPVHCVVDSPGAEFHGDLFVPSDAYIVSKATEPDVEAYSAFSGTPLENELRRRRVKRVFIAGLATDYCVKETALDAVKAGFVTMLIEDACKGVAADSTNLALEEMKAAGVRLCEAGNLQ